VEAIGVELGDRLKPPTRKNARGFFEDEELLEVNYRLRALFGLRRSGSTVTVIRPEQLCGDAVEALLCQATEIVERRFADHPVWGFKSGGTISFLPFWEEVFRRTGQEPCYVLALRNPLAVARSRAALSPWRGVQERSDLEWLVRNVPYFRRIVARPLAVVEFDRLMADPVRQLERMAQRLALPVGDATRAEMERFAKEFLDGRLRHNVFDERDLDVHPRVNPLARDAYRWLHRFAIDAVEAGDPDFEADWTRIENTLEAMEPVLRHLDRVEDESRWSVAGTVRLLRHELPRLRPALLPRSSA
jgi:hypothetical protein